MRKKRNILSKENIIYFVAVIIYLFSGIFTICFSGYSFKSNKVFLGIIQIVLSLPILFGVFILQKDRKKHVILQAVFAIIILLTGFVALFCKNIHIDEICRIFGLVGIFQGTYEAIIAINSVKKSKLEIVEFVVALGDIVFCALLCFHLSESLGLHFMYLGFEFIITSVKRFIELVTKNG